MQFTEHQLCYFQIYYTIINTIISADQHSAVYWTPTLLLSELLHYNKCNYISRPPECGLLNTKFATFKHLEKYSVRLESDAASLHNVLRIFPDHWFVRNVRNMASHPRGKVASYTPLWKYKYLQISPHLKLWTRSHRFKFQRISPALGS